jgi:glycerol-3-phosphate dehydrogenase
MTNVDVVIIGGGIAGLWTLAILRNLGYDAFLIESCHIGGIQSMASQGIIHGGTKYALGGKLGDSAKAIGDMPAIWKDCLNGTGELDLSAVEVHTRTQLMWSSQSAVSKVAGFFASKMMSDRMKLLKPDKFPAPFNTPEFDGSIYQLNEPVLNTASLMSVLYQQLREFCFKGNVVLDGKSLNTVICTDEGTGNSLRLQASQLVLTGGQGNEGLLKQLKRESPVMQRRPVHMVMLKSKGLPAIYAHCLAASSNPRVTITSTQFNQHTFWYVGGQIAETGVKRNRNQQINACRKELEDILPWVDFDNCQWSTLMLDRAEIQTPGNRRPESCFVKAQQQVITVWPTKLAFAPKAASEVVAELTRTGIQPSGGHVARPEWPQPELATWPWLDTQWS